MFDVNGSFQEIFYLRRKNYEAFASELWLIKVKIIRAYFQTGDQNLLLPEQRAEAGDEYTGATVIDPLKG